MNEVNFDAGVVTGKEATNRVVGDDESVEATTRDTRA